MRDLIVLKDVIKPSNIPALRDLSAKKPSFGPNIDTLDGVRGLAVLLVILSHTDALHLRGQGGIGVYLFFSLSGFLLTLPFTENPRLITSKTNLLSYFVRRARRILPMYWFVLTGLFLFQTRDLDLYFTHLSMSQADGHFWTIPQEVLFYIILPLFIGIVRFVLGTRKLLVACFLGTIAILANLYFDESVFALHGNGRWQRFYVGIFLTGMAFAYLYSWINHKLLRSCVKRIFDLSAMTFVILFFVTAKYYMGLVSIRDPALGSIGWRYPGIFGLMCGFIVFTSVFCRGMVTSRIMSHITLRAVGIVSFSMYLLHPLVIQVLVSLGFTEGTKQFLLCFPMTYLIAVATYSLIERPFLQID